MYLHLQYSWNIHLMEQQWPSAISTALETFRCNPLWGLKTTLSITYNTTPRSAVLFVTNHLVILSICYGAATACLTAAPQPLHSLLCIILFRTHWKMMLNGKTFHMLWLALTSLSPSFLPQNPSDNEISVWNKLSSLVTLESEGLLLYRGVFALSSAFLRGRTKTDCGTGRAKVTCQKKKCVCGGGELSNCYISKPSEN